MTSHSRYCNELVRSLYDSFPLAINTELHSNKINFDRKVEAGLTTFFYSFALLRYSQAQRVGSRSSSCMMKQLSHHRTAVLGIHIY